MNLKLLYTDPHIQWFRGALFSFTYIGVYGINLPFTQKWLKDIGFNYTMIGIIMALALFCSAITSPLLANLTDKIGRPKPLLIFLPLFGGISFFTLTQLSNIWLDVLGYIIVFICLISLMPLGDNMSIHILKRHRWPYGPMRAMGSLGFIFVVFFIAPKFQNDAPQAFVNILCIAMLVISFVALFLPNIQVEKRSQRAITPIFKSLIFIIFLAANFLLVHSHSILYVNGTNHWDDALNFTTKQIGYIWNIGVFAEVIIMIALSPFLLRLNPIWSMFIAASCAIVRWSIFTLANSFWLILLTNSLHGFTYGLFQIAAIAWVNKISPSGFSATGISLFAASTATATATGSLYAGYLYQRFGTQAFILDIFYALISLILIVILLKLDKNSKVILVN